MDVYQYIILAVVGIIAGFINTVGGGGSVIVISIMIFFGMPSAVANGTNRVALLFQNGSAVYNFKRMGYFDLKTSLIFALPAVVGSIAGSNIAVNIPDSIFNKLLAGVMVVVLLQIIFQPEKKLKINQEDEMTKKHQIIGGIVFFFVGIYGGMIQAGVGFVIIAAMTVITNYTLVRINSVKVFVVGLYTISSLVVFLMNGKVNIILGLCIAAGNVLGAYLGSRFAVLKGDKWIKIILAITISGLVIRLLLQ